MFFSVEKNQKTFSPPAVLANHRPPAVLANHRDCMAVAIMGGAHTHNQQGQIMGAKGHGTRRRLMQAARTLLESTTLAGLRIADIAGAAGTSTAAFYRYFHDAADIVLAVADECSQSTDALLHMAAGDWPPDEALRRAQDFVEAYVATWERNAAILRVRNLAAEAGDRRFYAAREKAVRPLQDALAARLRRAIAAGAAPPSLQPDATAGALIALLERVAAISRMQRDQKDVTHETLLHATAYILERACPALAD